MEEKDSQVEPVSLEGDAEVLERKRIKIDETLAIETNTNVSGVQLDNMMIKSKREKDPSPIKTLPEKQKGQATNKSPPTKPTQSLKFETLLFRSHSIDDSTIQSMTNDLRKPKSTIINDSIHGHINFGPHAMAIIDTPQFQRLRNIKQLGCCHWVYPTATHTRFQHSLGVAYLARKFVEHLYSKYPTLVDENDIKCVELAGLCHDLGHGPFSHLWESFVNKAHPNFGWHHEDNSIEMLDYLITDNNLKDVLLKDGIGDQDILFIKELIAGYIDPVTGLPSRPSKPKNSSKKEHGVNSTWLYRGRTERKAFLYEIVANKVSGIDVDKWDYFLRDKDYLKVNTVFDYQRFIMYSRIIKTGNPPRYKLCIRDKEAENLLDMFQDRARLHKLAYQHRVVRIVDRMLVDAFLLADSHVMVKGKNGKNYKLSEACTDIVAHEKLTDSVFDKILDSDCEDAKLLLRRIQKRQFYKSIAEIRVPQDHQLSRLNGASIEKNLRKYVEMSDTSIDDMEIDAKDSNETNSDVQVISTSFPNETPLKKEELIVIVRYVTMGMGNKNPMENVTFYCKNGKEDSVCLVDSSNLSCNLSDPILERTLWICCKRNEARPLKEAVRVVRSWSKTNNIQIDFH